MRSSFALSCTRLEPREVPAANLFADIRPGVWGSNPVMHGASGDTLYFSANDIYHGTELWATDGTKAGTRMVKDINPGKPGSGMYGIPAGGGVFYFIHSNEGSRVQTDYKTDGTAAGTVPIAHGINSIHNADGVPTTGWKGELYFYARTATPGVWSLSKTDGTTVTVLTTFNGQPLDTGYDGRFPYFPPGPSLYDNGTDRLQLTVKLKSGATQVWETDGTAAGTKLQQANLTATSPTTGDVTLLPGLPVGGGKFVFRSEPGYGKTTSSLWAGDGTSAARTLLRTFDGVQADTHYWAGQNAVMATGKTLFMVTPAEWNQPATADSGVWATDGTAAGTTRLNLPNHGERFPVARGMFDGKGVVQVPSADPNKWTVVLTDGTTTTPVPSPAGTGNLNWEFRGTVPADAASPKGFLLFQEAGGKAYRTDGTAAGTALVDTAGLPLAYTTRVPHFSWNDRNESVGFANWDSGRGFYFKGGVYFPGRDPNVQQWTQEHRYGTELWKWDLTAQPTTPTPTPAPAVTGTQVNDGSAQRSVVKSLTVTFNGAVNVAANGVSILNAAGRSPSFVQEVSTANGVTTLTIRFPAEPGGSIPDGRWTLKINAGAVTRQTGGTPMAADYTFGFTRVYGDLSGDGVYDREVRTLVKQLLGEEVGEPGYRWDLDANGDGKIDAADELAAVRNWGKAV